MQISKMPLMQIAIFKLDEDKPNDFEMDINVFLQDLCENQVPHQITTLESIVYILYDSDKLNGGGIQ